MAAPYIAQTAQVGVEASSTGIAFTNDPKAGACLVLLVALEDQESVSSITHAGVTWVRHIQEVGPDTANDSTLEIWVAQKIPIGTSKTATVNFSGSAAKALIMVSVLGIETIAVDQSVSDQGTDATPDTGTTATTTQADTIAIAGVANSDPNDSHITFTNSFSLHVEQDGGGASAERQHLSLSYKVLTSTQAVNTGCTISPFSAPDQWAAGLVVLRADGTGAQSGEGSSLGSGGGSGFASVLRDASGSAPGTSGASGDADVAYSASGSSLGVGSGIGIAQSSSSHPAVDVEIPAFYLDDILADPSGTDLQLVNRTPGPDATQVPTTTDLYVDIVNISTAAIDPDSVEISFDGVDALVGQTWDNGFTGYFHELTSPGAGSPDGYRVVITPPAAFPSLLVITIRVIAETVGGGADLDETYSFTIEDLTAPEAAVAFAFAKNAVGIAFDEPVRMLGDGDVADALTPSNYVFTALNDSITPAVSIVAQTVAMPVVQLVDNAVIITLDTEMTRHQSCEGNPLQYQVTINGVEDLFGNVISAQVAFDAFQPTWPAAREFCIYRMLPALNRNEDFSQDLLRFANIIQEVVDLLLCDIDAFVDIYDVNRATGNFLDVILASLGNPFAFDLTETRKRKLALILVDIYKLKGTNPGICSALRFFLAFATCDVVEYNDLDTWVLGESELGLETFLGLDDSFSKYSFDIQVDRVLTADELAQLEEIVDYMKPAHTHHIHTLEP